MTKLEQRALEILRGYDDPACYEEMVGAIMRGQADVLEARVHGVLVRHVRANLNMLAGEPYRMRDLALEVGMQAGDVLIHGAMPVDDLMSLKRALKRDYLHPMINYAYYGNLPPEEDTVEIRPLTMDDLDFLYENYGHATREYLAERIADGVMIGAQMEGQLVGFIGEHVEGSMGLLHIMPQFRRHQLGYKLERADIRRTMLRGQTPFCQVMADNSASRRLQDRLGMTEAKHMLYWITNDPM